MFRRLETPSIAPQTATAFGLFVFLVVTWHVYAMILGRAYVLPNPLEVFGAGWDLLERGMYRSGKVYRLHDLFFLTMWRVVPGVLAGSLLGYISAVFASQFPILRAFSLTLSAMLYAVSALAVFVLLQHWMGTGETAKWLLAAWVGFAVTFSLVYRRSESMFAGREALCDWMRILGVSPLEFALRHAWPLLGRQAIISAQWASLLTWKLTPITDPVGDNPQGVGLLIMYGTELEGGTPLMFVGVILGVVGTGLTWLLFELLGRLLRGKWETGER